MEQGTVPKFNEGDRVRMRNDEVRRVEYFYGKVVGEPLWNPHSGWNALVKWECHPASIQPSRIPESILTKARAEHTPTQPRQRRGFVRRAIIVLLDGSRVR